MKNTKIVPKINPKITALKIIILLLILISTKNRLYLLMNSPDINLFLKFMYNYL